MSTVFSETCPASSAERPVVELLLPDLMLWTLGSQWRYARVMGVPSGKRLHNYGKSPLLIGNSTINGHFQ